nr:MAG TPA: hypothetical protein [Caudoviricetes sp.]
MPLCFCTLIINYIFQKVKKNFYDFIRHFTQKKMRQWCL